MSPDVITIVIAIVAVGVSLAALIVTGQRSLTARMDRLELAIHSLGERVARLEGAFPFLTARPPESGGPHHPNA